MTGRPVSRGPALHDRNEVGEQVCSGGVLKAASPCYDLLGSVRMGGGQITLRVRATPETGDDCAGVGAFRYTAVTGDVARRTYRLNVIHEVVGGEAAALTLNLTVVD